MRVIPCYISTLSQSSYSNESIRINRSNLLLYCSQVVRSYQYVLPQYPQRFFRFFEYGAVSRLLKRIKTFDRRFEFLRIVLYQLEGANVIIYAFKEIDGQSKIPRLVKITFFIPKEAA